MPLSESGIIERIRRAAKKRGPGSLSRVVAGIGDDCSIVRSKHGEDVLVTTDFSLEGMHFRREWHPPESVGHRCLVRGLSDISAMGGEPVAAFLSLALPAKLEQKWVDGFLRGFLTLARKFNVSLAGGDTAESPAGVLADVMVLGSVPSGKAILRSGARPGDQIYVTGSLGDSASVLKGLFANPKRKYRLERSNAQLWRHFFPEPRTTLGRFLREKKLASAMIDVSDGLSTDLEHICDESRCGAEVEAAAVPHQRSVDLKLALNGGDDYELLFTSASTSVPESIGGIKVTRIGEVTRRRKVSIIENGRITELKPGGWQHFGSR